MRRWLHLPRSAFGQIILILLVTSAIEFAISTLLYERASSFSVQEDEARRLAEHLVVARRVLSDQRPERRPAAADELTTDRYIVRWTPKPPILPPVAPALDGMYDQIVDWEPSLDDAGLRLRFVSPGARSVVAGHIRLADGSWMRFRTREAVKTLDLAFTRILLALAPAVALLLLGGILIKRTLKPLGQLADAAERLGRGDPAPVPERGSGEIRRLTFSFNQMQRRISRLIDERTRALAAVGHDLRTPLARLQLEVDGVDDVEIRRTIRAELDEMDVMIASLLAFLGGEGDVERAVLVDVAVLCANLVDEAQDRGRDADYHGPNHLEWIVRPVGFKRALTNLVDNAIHYGNRIDLHLEQVGGTVKIRVEDDGPGIPPDQIALAFEPFVRLDPARRRDTIGFGLGLSIVDRAIRAEGGTVELANRTTGGLCATICLPG